MVAEVKVKRIRIQIEADDGKSTTVTFDSDDCEIDLRFVQKRNIVRRFAVGDFTARELIPSGVSKTELSIVTINKEQQKKYLQVVQDHPMDHFEPCEAD